MSLVFHGFLREIDCIMLRAASLLLGAFEIVSLEEVSSREERTRDILEDREVQKSADQHYVTKLEASEDGSIGISDCSHPTRS